MILRRNFQVLLIFFLFLCAIRIIPSYSAVPVVIQGKVMDSTTKTPLKRISNIPPKIVRIRPKSGSTFLAGADVKIKVYAFDRNKDVLEYRFLIGGAIQQAWSAANTYIWHTVEADTGAVSIICEVRDNKGGRDAQTISCQIINPTVEEILKRVADNYAMISDFKADMALSATLDGQLFGDTEYCRYYFMAPNKEKTETYSDQARSKKTEIIIIDGPVAHFIDRVENTKESVDMRKETGMNTPQFNQMDIYYNPPLFLSYNAVTKNKVESDFNNMVIALDVVPNEPNLVYEKLTLSINYKKGILVKQSILRENITGELETEQEIKTINVLQMPNSAWIPVKMTKTPNLTSGALVSTLTYSNVEINTGLVNSDFDPETQ